MSWFDDNVLKPEYAGMTGALLGLFKTPGDKLHERVFNLGAGLGAAWFLTPWILEVMSIKTHNGGLAVAFVVGLVGMNLLAKIIEQAKMMKLVDVLSFVFRRGGTKE